MGYRRSDGSVGVRNEVAVLAAMDNINPVVRSICKLAPRALPITMIAGRGQFGQDNVQTQRTIIGLGKNPNLAAVLVVSLEPTSAGLLAGAIAACGKPVRTVTVQECGGSLNTACAGARIAAEMLIDASQQVREECDLSSLMLAVECGGTDTTSGLAANPILGMVADQVIEAGGTVLISEVSELLGAEHILAARAVNPKVAKKILDVINNVEAEAKRRGVDIRGANPVPDNIRGGITTLEEKSLGGMVKAGTKTIMDVLDYAAAPSVPGLYIMDTPAPACESLTGLAAAGCQLCVFTTGVGNSIGHPVLPCIKITANPKTVVYFADNIDLSVEKVLRGEESMTEAAARLYDDMLKVASGKMVRAEVLEQIENANTKIQPTV
ncbi:hypothetical protein DCMF_06400 [Candidatus Formimonas warabiya]|uniref:Uncharacterized protein n=2 Tax=Formimonas warabiya TaxID=1761012 RepID=A0A3G1L164_FORW1|nr:hypothetical protein DCMF_06400 [Candidatus Formimonas warabiya]